MHAWPDLLLRDVRAEVRQKGLTALYHHIHADFARRLGSFDD